MVSGFPFQRQKLPLPAAELNLGDQPVHFAKASDRIFVLAPRMDIIPCTFRGLHTVYASSNLAESCFFTVLTPAAKRKIGSNNPLLVPKLLY